MNEAARVDLRAIKAPIVRYDQLSLEPRLRDEVASWLDEQGIASTLVSEIEKTPDQRKNVTRLRQLLYLQFETEPEAMFFRFRWG